MLILPNPLTEHTWWPRRYRRCSSMTLTAARLTIPSSSPARHGVWDPPERRACPDAARRAGALRGCGSRVGAEPPGQRGRPPSLLGAGWTAPQSASGPRHKCIDVKDRSAHRDACLL